MVQKYKNRPRIARIAVENKVAPFYSVTVYICIASCFLVNNVVVFLAINAWLSVRGIYKASGDNHSVPY